MRTDKNTPALITVTYKGSMPRRNEEKAVRALLTQQFNEVASILAKNGAELDLNNMSIAERAAHGSVPQANFERLKDELKNHQFEVRQKYVL